MFFFNIQNIIPKFNHFFLLVRPFLDKIIQRDTFVTFCSLSQRQTGKQTHRQMNRPQNITSWWRLIWLNHIGYLSQIIFLWPVYLFNEKQARNDKCREKSFYRNVNSRNIVICVGDTVTLTLGKKTVKCCTLSGFLHDIKHLLISMN